MKTKTILLSAALLLCGLAFFLFGNKEKALQAAKLGATALQVRAINDTIAWAELGIRQSPLPGKTYQRACQEAIQKKTNYQEQRDGEAGKLFEELLLNQIIPYWYGTEWSFEGHTSEPRKGKIACGYFVSTTLSQLGVKVDRYKLAQQSPIKEAESLALDGKVIEISAASGGDKFADIRAAIGEGICFVGLGSSHVGYLLKRKNELFFLHSSYFAPSAVCIEKAEASEVFNAYDRYHLVELSNHPAFIQKWLKGESIQVITDR